MERNLHCDESMCYISPSAAKAPFLARFKVAKCGTSRVEELNIKEDAGKIKASPF